VCVYVRVVCAVNFLLSYLVERRQCAGFSCDSHMVKMSRRDRLSAIQEIRCWSTEQLQKFLTDVSCTLCRDVSLLSSELSGFVLFMNTMAWRVKTVIARFVS
jgi:hypothetical protein